MMLRLRTAFLLVFVAAGLSSVSAHGSDSPFPVEKTQRLTRSQQALFGPRSGSLHYDPRMIRAAEIAQRRAHPRMTWHCWKYVKDALLAANVISTRPTSPWAKQAGSELCAKYGFRRLDIVDPYRAPVGSVVVYGGPDAGHVELRTAHGFVSDFISASAYPRPLVGIFVKPS